jgi:hypothetical protein
MKPEICECCGAKIYRYWHKLNKPLCQALLKFFETGREKKVSDLGLSHSQICNFQKLKYWGLIKKSTGKLWKITHDGTMFCLGQLSIADRVQTFRDRPVKYSEKLIDIAGILPDEYRKLQDYLADREVGIEQARLF